jgi:hypothetical protein
LWCGYDLRGAAIWRCPECGRELDEVDLKTHERRKFVRERAVRRFVGWMIALAVCVAGVAGVVLFSRVGRVWPWAPLLLLSGLLAAGVTIAGGALCAFAAAGFRRMYLWVWLSVLGRLHAPWLVVGLGAIVFVVAGYIARAMGVERLGDAVIAGLFFGGIAWLVIALVIAKSWTARIGEVEHELGLLRSGFRTALAAAGWLTLAGSIAMGLTGGIVASVWTYHVIKH